MVIWERFFPDACPLPWIVLNCCMDGQPVKGSQTNFTKKNPKKHYAIIIQVVVSNIFIFTPIWGRFPIWLIFFRWVETTNQLYMLAFVFQLYHVVLLYQLNSRGWRSLFMILMTLCLSAFSPDFVVIFCWCWGWEWCRSVVCHRFLLVNNDDPIMMSNNHDRVGAALRVWPRWNHPQL